MNMSVDIESLCSDDISALICPVRVNATTVVIKPDRTDKWGYRCSSYPNLTAFYMFWGEGGVFSSGSEILQCRHGDVVMLPRILPHTIAGLSAQQYNMLDFSNIIRRDMEHYFFQAASLAPDGTLQPTEVSKSAYHYPHGVTMIYMETEPASAQPLFRHLPPIIKINLMCDPALDWVNSLAGLLRSENKYARHGRAAIMQRLNELFIAECALEYFAQREQPLISRAALEKPRLTALIAGMHRNPENFTRSLACLAAVVNMSRSAFSAAFTCITGHAPISYLRKLQMGRAAELIDSGVQISQLLVQFHYSSDLTFQHAFRREIGVSPAAYRKRNLNRTGFAGGSNF